MKDSGLTPRVLFIGGVKDIRANAPTFSVTIFYYKDFRATPLFPKFPLFTAKVRANTSWPQAVVPKSKDNHDTSDCVSRRKTSFYL
jgi:hypothetical protein